MIDQHDHQTDTTPEDQALLDAARRLQQVLELPFAVGLLAVAGAAILFWLSFSIGETVYRAFDRDDDAAMFGLTFGTVVVAIVAIWAWLDHRRHARDDERPLNVVRPFQQVVRHPFAVGFLAVAGVLILFWLGIGVGETLYGAFDGNAGGAAVFGITFATAIVAVVAIGAWLDRRRRVLDDNGGPLTDEQR